MPRVLLLGLGPTALTALESLAERFEVAGVVRACPPPGRAGRRRRARSCPRRSGVPRRGARRRGAPRPRQRPDCVVVSSYDRILPGRVLARCPFMNVHYAPLPEYRGRANVNWAILNGEPETAITVHVMAPGLDAGNILFQQRVPIASDDTVGDLYAKLNAVQRRCSQTASRRICRATRANRRTRRGHVRMHPGPRRRRDRLGGPDRARLCVDPRARRPVSRGAHLSGGTAPADPAGPAPAGPATLCRPRSGARRGPLVTERIRRHTDRRRRAEDQRGGRRFGMPSASTVITSTRQTLGLRTADLLARIESLESRLRSLDGSSADPRPG